jgi:hypothetical protein
VPGGNPDSISQAAGPLSVPVRIGRSAELAAPNSTLPYIKSGLSLWVDSQVDQGHPLHSFLQLSDMGKELFVGTFVHSLSLEHLEIGDKGAIGVEDGKIVFVEKDIADVEAVKKAHGFEGAKVRLLLMQETN